MNQTSLNTLTRSGISAVAALAFAATGISTHAVTILNHSFEAPLLADGNWDSGADNWSGSNFGIENPVDSMFAGTSDNGPIPSPGEGTQIAWINAGGNVFQHVGLLQPNTEYTLTVAIGERLDRSDPLTLDLELYNGQDRNGVLLGSSVTSAPDEGTFQSFSLIYSSGADASGNLTIAINNGTGGQGIIDNVQLTAVPEPSTYAAILGALFLGFAVWRRRR